MSSKQPTLDAAAIQRILEERARTLARSPSNEVAVKTLPLVELTVGTERFGINLQYVQEIQPLKGLAPVPGVPAHWAGVVNLRGRLYPVLDLRRYLMLPAAGPPEGGQLVVVAAAKLEVALWASDIIGIRHVPQTEIRTSLLESGNLPPSLVVGVTAELLSVLDLDVLLADPKLVVQEQG